MTSWLCQLILGMFPDIGSKFILAFGIQSFFDPIFITCVDLAIGVSSKHIWDFAQLPI